jgi:eukaryotic-like serine/threonine-protein kinase
LQGYDGAVNETGTGAPAIVAGESRAPGARLGPYELVARLGAGGMGEVWRARDPRLGRDVALKLLPPELARDPEALRRFDVEARAASALDHPNIMAVHDVGEAAGTSYVVCELLEGETLRSAVGGGPLPPRRAIGYARDILAGLAAAHEKGIIHRDLKPDNLFVTRQDRVKILDFGLAKLVEKPSPDGSITATGAVLGTAAYMAPEQIRGGTVDARSDIFSFGLVLYRMLAGRPAFAGATQADVMSSILKDDPQPLPDVPPALERIVLRCLEKAPARRYHSARDLELILEELALPATGRAVAAPPARRRWWRAPAVALLAAAAAAALLLYRPRRPAPPSFHRLTYRSGEYGRARFGRDGTVYFGARFPGEAARRLYALVPGEPELRRLEIPGATDVCGVGARELLVQLADPSRAWPTLARAPLAGGPARPFLDDVVDCDVAASDEAVAVIRLQGGRWRVEFPLGQVVHEGDDVLGWLDVSLDGRRVAFTHHPVPNFSIGEVMVAERGRPARAISRRFQSIYGLAWSPLGEVWVTASDVGTRHPVLALGLHGGERRVAGSANQLTLYDVARDGRAVLFASETNPQLRFRGAGDGEEHDLTWLDGSWLQQITDDGSKLLVIEDEDGGGKTARTYLRPTDGSDPTLLALGLGSALSRDGKLLLVTPRDPTGAIDIVPVGSGDIEHLPAAVPGRRARALWFGDGQNVLYEGRDEAGQYQLYVQRRGATTARALGRPGLRTVTQAALSADDERLLVADLQHRFYVLPTGGGEAEPVRGMEPGEIALRWTDDDRRIFVARVAGDTLHVDRLDPTTGARTPALRLPNGQAIDSFAITPDGRAYGYRLGQGGQLYLLEEAK